MNSLFFKYSRMKFSVLPKLPKLEITMKSPYKTYFKNFNGFQRLYIGTVKGQLCIGNRTNPVIYLLPAGEIKLTGLVKAEGNNVDANASGEFVHSGGVCIVHDNNSVDINVYECVEKEKFAFDKVDTSSIQNIDTDSRYDKEAANYAFKKLLKKK